MKFNEIKGCENQTVMLVKFTKSKYVQDFLDGNLYMNNFKYFVDQEKRTEYKGQGDSYEGAFVTKFGPSDIYIDDVPVGFVHGGELTMRNENIDKVPLFSMSVLMSRDFEVVEDKGDRIVLKVDFSDEDIQEFKKSFECDKAVFTIQNQSFINKLKCAANEIQTTIATGSTEYVDFSVMDSKHNYRKQRFDQGHIDFLFHKNSSLKYQREFRVVLPNIQVDQNYIFKVGELKEDFYVIDIDDFFSGMKLELGLKELI